ncbi:hypothetical protein KY347_03095 [Candidatus Woesearchaeota archaeon]|nr:hypothetical protein [Candidatus Woesearchaeota archaeon]
MELFRKRKSQAAMEFLMTYGWAILVVLAAIAALAYFGVLSPERFMPEKCVLAPGLACVSFRLETGELEMYISNGLGKTIQITEIALDEPAGATDFSCAEPFTTNLRSGEQEQFFIPENDGEGDDTCSFGTEAGDPYRGDIRITYTETATGILKTIYGDIATKIEG